MRVQSKLRRSRRLQNAMSGNVQWMRKFPERRGSSLVFLRAHGSESVGCFPDHALATAAIRKQRVAPCFRIFHETVKVYFKAACFAEVFRLGRRNGAHWLFAGKRMAPKG